MIEAKLPSVARRLRERVLSLWRGRDADAEMSDLSDCTEYSERDEVCRPRVPALSDCLTGSVEGPGIAAVSVSM